MYSLSIRVSARDTNVSPQTMQVVLFLPSSSERSPEILLLVYDKAVADDELTGIVEKMVSAGIESGGREMQRRAAEEGE